MITEEKYGVFFSIQLKINPGQYLDLISGKRGSLIISRRIEMLLEKNNNRIKYSL